MFEQVSTFIVLSLGLVVSWRGYRSQNEMSRYALWFFLLSLLVWTYEMVVPTLVAALLTRSAGTGIEFGVFIHRGPAAVLNLLAYLALIMGLVRQSL